MNTALAPFLQGTAYIDVAHPLIRAKAEALARGIQDAEKIAERCFLFVRDEIAHSWDFRRNPVTCSASEVLMHGTGYCYAKSHLLAALLRANHIPAGLCYQRLSLGTGGAPYCLHGLNAMYLPAHGWYRVDARGNKPGVDAAFKPPTERLAFAIAENAEADLPGIWAEPHPQVVAALTAHSDVTALYANLPDVSPADWGSPS